MLGGLERGTLDFVRVHRGERRVIELAGANPDHALDRLHEDLAVADFTGARGRQDRLDARLHEGLGADHLDLHLFLEFHDDGGATILLDDLLLAPVAADAGQRDPGDAGPKQRRLDLWEALGPHDSGDEFHGSKLARPFLTVNRFLHLMHDFTDTEAGTVHGNRCAAGENVPSESDMRNSTFWCPAPVRRPGRAPDTTRGQCGGDAPAAPMRHRIRPRRGGCRRSSLTTD